MLWSTWYDEEEGIVRAHCRGVQRAEYTADMAREVADLGREQGCRYFLVDVRETLVEDTAAESYAHASDPACFGMEQLDRVAVVYASDAFSHQLAEKVFSNRGYRVRYFVNEKDALQWLRDAASLQEE